MTDTLAPSTPERSVPTRRMSFEEQLRELPRHFAGDDLLTSHFIAALSAVFPDGEDFFVASVRQHRAEITDPALKRQIAGFIGQESVHGREHRLLNDRFAELGYPTKFWEAYVRKGFALRSRVAPPISNLAATAALEHYTATLAEHVLSNEETRSLFGHDGVRNVFLWHALEEAEHKAVAFDVYRAAGGGERMRTWTMNGVTVAFILTIALQMVTSLAKDRAAWNPMRLWRSFKKFRRAPMFNTGVWAQLREYNRRGFHPDDIDSTELVDEWRERLFGEHGTLRDNLANAAA